MTLEKELAEARKDVVTDGYDMSIGEIVSLYRDDELTINPAFQRYFRWDEGRKTRFIESILLGIPIPPIFVFQTEEGSWELVDGLQRVSTLLEFLGELHDAKERKIPPSVLDGTKLLPSLAEKSWDGHGTSTALSTAQKLDIRRARMRVEILKRESDPTSKFELFQRLNTGGAELSEQEVRNCTLVMMNPRLHEWLLDLSKYETFHKCISLSAAAKDRQQSVELVVRFLAFRLSPYKKGLDVHDYLDGATIELAGTEGFPMKREEKLFKDTFTVIHESLGDKSFRRWNGSTFTGKFLMSVFEVMAYGIPKNLPALRKKSLTRRKEFILRKAKALWSDETFKKYSGAGVRGSTRLTHLLPFAVRFMKP